MVITKRYTKNHSNAYASWLLLYNTVHACFYRVFYVYASSSFYATFLQALHNCQSY
jgi:hypothetical protein